LRALNLELFTLPSKSDFLRDCQAKCLLTQKKNLTLFNILVIQKSFINETFEKYPILFKAKKGDNFNHMNTLSI